VKPPGEQIHRPAIGVVGRVIDELIIGAELDRSGDGVAVIGFDDLLPSRIWQMPLTSLEAERILVVKPEVCRARDLTRGEAESATNQP
jgi:hypothetical protein